VLIILLGSCTNNSTKRVTAFIECLPGDSLKYEFNNEYNIVIPDSSNGELRVLRSEFPTYYGFIDNFVSADGDFLDCFIFSKSKLARSNVSQWNVVGVLRMLDEGVEDCKMILSNRDVSNKEINDVVQFLLKYSDDEVCLYPFIRTNKMEEVYKTIKEFQKSSRCK
jgi:inorganic pyrophosphatase